MFANSLYTITIKSIKTTSFVFRAIGGFVFKAITDFIFGTITNFVFMTINLLFDCDWECSL